MAGETEKSKTSSKSTRANNGPKTGGTKKTTNTLKSNNTDDVYSINYLIAAGFQLIAYNAVDGEYRCIEQVWQADYLSGKMTWVYSSAKGARVLTKPMLSSGATFEDFDTQDVTGYEWGNVIFNRMDCMPQDIFGRFESTIEEKYKNTPINIIIMYDNNMLSNPVTIRQLKELLAFHEEVSVTLVAENVNVPNELSSLCTTISMPLPDEDLIAKMIANTIEDLNEAGHSFKITKKCIKETAYKLLGLTLIQAQNVVRITLKSTKKLDDDIVTKMKAETLKISHPAVQYYDTVDIEIGGFGNYINYLNKYVKPHLTPNAITEGLPRIGATMFLGPPGCGKSTAPKEAANILGIPLLRFDISMVLNKYVGESEKVFKSALDLAERLSPCVLWIDEIEKALSGTNGINSHEVSVRMLGSFLTWLQEHKSFVYVIATANNIKSLAKELLRPGRFDTIFFADLPTEKERKSIYEIMCRKYQGVEWKMEFSEDEYKELAKATDGFTGAEIERTIVEAKTIAFSERRACNMEDVMKNICNTKPASKGILGDTINELRTWAAENGIKNVSDSEEN